MSRNYVSPEEVSIDDGIFFSQNGITQPLNLHRVNKALNGFNAPPFTHPWYDMTMEEIMAKEVTGSRLNYFYGLFDALVAKDTAYGSRRVYEVDAWGNDVVEYTFRSSNIGRNTGLLLESTTPPRILIVSGMNGQELDSILTFYLFMLDVLENWEKDAFCMRMYTSVEFKVLLCSTPSSIISNNNTNRNGVDINRNFEVDWFKSGIIHGAQAMSERDTVNISNWIESYRGRNIGLLELHDHTGDGSTFAGTYHPMHQRIAIRALRKYGEWLYESPLGRSIRPSYAVRGSYWSWYPKSSMGSLAKHCAIKLRQPSIFIAHSYANHPQLGDGVYWQRTSFRLLLRCMVDSLLEHNANYEFYDEIL